MKTTISLTRTTPTPEPRQLLWGDVTEPGLYWTRCMEMLGECCMIHFDDRSPYHPPHDLFVNWKRGLVKRAVEEFGKEPVTRLPDDYKLVIELSNGGRE
jgi:hypothetical protein